VQEEVEYLARTRGIASFSFIDPVFNLTPDRLMWLAEMLEPHATAGLGLHTIEVDIERIDAEQASLLARAGVKSVENRSQSVATPLWSCATATSTGSVSQPASRHSAVPVSRSSAI